MMEENNDIFLAGGDALVYLAVFHICLWTSVWYILGPIFQPLIPCKHMYAFRVTVFAVGLFQNVLLNTIAHMC